MNTTGHKWLTVQDLSKRLQISVRSVYRLCDAGRIPWGRKIGGARRWLLAEIEGWEVDGCKPVRRATSTKGESCVK